MSIQPAQQRRVVEIRDWSKGVDSFVPPIQTPPGFGRWMTDCVTKGNLVQTRPGYRTSLAFDVSDSTLPYKAWWIAAGKPVLIAQGAKVFVANGGYRYLVFAVSGSVWSAPINPDGTVQTASQLTQLQFLPGARQVVFCAAVQSSAIIDGLVSALSIPNNLLLMQDGVSRCGWYDGQGSGHYNPQKGYTQDAQGNTIFTPGFNQTRIGQWMAWSGNRLFVGNGTQVFSSDLNDPADFTEELTLTSVPVINFPDAITGMIDRGTSGTQNSLLIVYTRTTTWSIYSGVQARIPNATLGYPGWQGTPNFLSAIFSGTGCVAGKSVVNHRGLLYWLSSSGVVVFDSIATVNSTQSIPPIDYEEAYSKQLCGLDLSGACSGINDSYIFFAMPVGPVMNGLPQNGHIQVLDRQITVLHSIGIYGPTIYAQAGWQGVWTGIRPVELTTAAINGMDRTYALSMDTDGVPRIWEMMQGNRADNGSPIPWTFETPQHPMGQSLFDTANFLFARMMLIDVLGNVEAQVLWKGTRGVYKKVMDINLSASPGTVLAPTPQDFPITSSTVFGSCVPQSRVKRTENTRGPYLECQSSAVEGDGTVDATDRAFSLLFRFKGRAGIQVYRIEADDTPNTTEGRFPTSETGQHFLKGGSCPEFIDGPVPTYILAEDTPRNALAAVQNNQLFASQDTPQQWLAAPNPPALPVDTQSTADAVVTTGVAFVNDLYSAPPVNPFLAPDTPPIIPPPPYPTPGYVMFWPGPIYPYPLPPSFVPPAPPSLLYGNAADGTSLNYPVQFLQMLNNVVVNGKYNGNGTATDNFYYQGQAPFSTNKELFASMLLADGELISWPFASWPAGQAVVINSTVKQIKLDWLPVAIGDPPILTMILMPGQYQLGAIVASPPYAAYNISVWNGSSYVLVGGNVIPVASAPGRTFVQVVAPDEFSVVPLPFTPQ